MSMLERRKTADVVVMLMTGMVAVTIVVATCAVVIGKIMNPALEITRAVEIISNILTTTVGALVGFVGGRATGKLEAGNGPPSEYNV